MPDYQQHEKFGVHYLRPTSDSPRSPILDTHSLGHAMMTESVSPRPSIGMIRARRRLLQRYMGDINRRIHLDVRWCARKGSGGSSSK